MNVQPGGLQPQMCNMTWAEKMQKMVFEDGTPKGKNQVLEERGNNTTHLVAEDMIVLSWHDARLLKQEDDC